MRAHISGKEATYVALEANERRPIALKSPAVMVPAAANVPEPGTRPETTDARRKAPVRVRKPSPGNDRCLAPTPDLENHRARLRDAFGSTMSDEFVDVMLGKLVEALRPSPHDHLEEATMNAGLAIITSMQPSSELEALLAIQIIATGFSGMRFLRQSHRHMDEVFIDVYGSYAIKLLRLQAELIQAFDRHRRGNRQTVEVRHVHLYPGSQGVIGIVNNGQDNGEERERK
jgi:hypothetical protein